MENQNSYSPASCGCKILVSNTLGEVTLSLLDICGLHVGLDAEDVHADNVAFGLVRSAVPDALITLLADKELSITIPDRIYDESEERAKISELGSLDGHTLTFL